MAVRSTKQYMKARS
uniref:Uncharacterized protein n=1 Tax=Vitis vinifera TaxID=29760 RepID=F6HMJ4_VITVI